MNTMTLQQVRDSLRAMKSFPDSTFNKWADAIDAHLTRQPEVSDEDVELACLMHTNTHAYTLDYTKAMRAALNAVWHNRPSQEKAEPVARVVISEAGRVGICPLPGKALKLYNGQELYTAPPAERVRVMGERERCAALAEQMADMMEAGAGEIRPGQRFRQVARQIRDGMKPGYGVSAAPEVSDHAPKRGEG